MYAILKRIEHNDEYLIASLNHRTSLRNEIDEELKNLLEELKSKNGNILSSFFALCHHGVKMEFAIYDVLRKCNYKTCLDCELHNVNQYYNTLYIIRSKRNLIDILLKQKSCIENYLIKEM